MADQRAQLRQELKAAREALDKKEWKEALQHCKTALKLDSKNYNVFVFIGLAAAELGQEKQSEEAYRRATALQPATILAWQGLAKLYQKTAEWAKFAEVYEAILKLIPEDQAKKKKDLTNKLADTYIQAANRDKAVAIWCEILSTAENEGNILDMHEVLRKLLSQFKALEEEENARETATQEDKRKAASQVDELLRKVMGMNIPGTATYYDEYIQRLRKQLASSADPQQSQELRREIIQCCREAVQRQAALAVAYETLLEIAEEDNTTIERDEHQRILKKYIRLFPYRPLSWLLLGSFLLGPLPSPSLHNQFVKTKEQQGRSIDDVIALLELGLKSYSAYVPCWILLAELYLRNQSFQQSIECVNKGLQAIKANKLQMKSQMQKPYTNLQLIQAKAYHLSKKRKEAQQLYMSVLSRDEANTSALMGLAEAYLEAKDTSLAEEMFKKALAINPALDNSLFHLGLIEFNRGGFEAASKLFSSATEINNHVSSYYYHLGRSYWHLGGEYKVNKKYAQAQFLQSAKLDPLFPGNFTYLGHYYRDVETDLVKAKRCYQKALSLSDSLDSEAGSSLSDLFIASGQKAAAVTLWKEVTSKSNRVQWAWRNLAFHYIKNSKYSAAIPAFQNVLRLESKDSVSWKGLAQSYLATGKFVAALKGFERALELDPTCAASRYQVACTKLLLGQIDEATIQFRDILQTKGDYLPAMKGLAQSLISLATSQLGEGLIGRAADNLREAKQILEQCLKIQDNLQCLWKLLGDVLTLHYHLPFVPSEWTQENIRKSKNEKIQCLSEGAKAYEKALLIDANCAALYYDLAVNAYYRAVVIEDHLPLDDSSNREKAVAEAVAWLKKAISLDSKNGLYWNTMGVLLQRTLPAVSQHCFITAIKINDNDDKAWVNLGHLYLHYNDYDLAEQAFLRAQSINPDNTSVWAGHALLAESDVDTSAPLGRLKSSSASYLQACLLDNPTPLSREGMGYTGYLMGGSDMITATQSMDIFMRAHPLHKHSAGGWNLLGLLNEARGVYDTAFCCFSNSLALLPEPSRSPIRTTPRSMMSVVPDAFKDGQGDEGKANIVLQNRARILMKLRRYTEAVQDFKRAGIGASGELHDLADVIQVWELGRAQFLSGQVEESVQTHRQLLAQLETANSQASSASLSKAHKGTLLLLCQLAYHQNDITQAKRYVMQCVKFDGSYLGGWQMMSGLGILIGDYDVAQTAIQQIHKLSKAPSAQLYTMQAVLQLAQNRKQEAKQTMSKAYHLNPDDEHFWDLFGWLIMDNWHSGNTLRTLCTASSHLSFPKLQDYLSRERLLTQAMLQLGRNVPSSFEQVGGSVDRWDHGINSVLSHIAKIIRVDPSDEQAWFLYAVATYFQCCVSPSSNRASRSAILLRHVLDSQTKQKAVLQEQLTSSKEPRTTAVLLPQVHKVEERILFLRLAISDCSLISGGNVDEAVNLAKESAASVSFTNEDAKKQAVALCHRQLGRCHLAQKQVDLAIEEYKKAVAIRGGVDPLFLLELAEIYRAHGMVNYATTTYQQITKAFSGDERLVALLQLTHLFISVDKWEEAQETIVQLNKLQADHPVGLYLQGLIFIHKKEYYKARAVILDSIRKEERRTGTPLPLAHWHLAQIYAQLKDERANALSHAQQELTLLSSAYPAVPSPTLQLAEFTVATLNQTNEPSS